MAAQPKRRHSFRRAIDAFCRYCIYDPRGGVGTWREQVDACPATDCPLFPVRPRSEGGGRRGKTAPSAG